MPAFRMLTRCSVAVCPDAKVGVLFLYLRPNALISLRWALYPGYRYRIRFFFVVSIPERFHNV